MTFTTGYPSDGTAVATLVIPRVFGDNGHRSGVTNDHVFQVMSSQKWGLIQGIDCHDKKDFRTGENFRMMFVRWTHFAPPVEVKKALDDGGHIEIDIDDYGHFWKIRNFVPRVKTHAQETTNDIRLVTPDEDNNTNSTNKNNKNNDFPILGNPKNVTFQGIWDINNEFTDEMTAFCDSGLSVQELSIADELQDSFDKMLQQNLHSQP